MPSKIATRELKFLDSAITGGGALYLTFCDAISLRMFEQIEDGLDHLPKVISHIE